MRISDWSSDVCSSDLGYLHGALAPGHRNLFETPIASHNLMRAHGAAVRAYRSEGAHEIGLVVNIEPKYPASDSAEDVAATARAHAYMNRQYLDPALKGFYPEELAKIFGEAWPAWPAEDLQEIGRASWRERGCQYVSLSVVAVTLKNKRTKTT